MNNQIGHVSDEIRCESNVEQHVKDIEHFFSWVHCMQVTVSSGCKGHNGPIQGIRVA